MQECFKFANKVCLTPLLVVKFSCSNGGSMGSIAGGAAKIPHALQPEETKNRNNIGTNSIKTFKTVHIKYVCMYIYIYIYTYMLKLTQLRNTQPEILPLEGAKTKHSIIFSTCFKQLGKETRKREFIRLRTETDEIEKKFK